MVHRVEAWERGAALAALGMLATSPLAASQQAAMPEGPMPQAAPVVVDVARRAGPVARVETARIDWGAAEGMVGARGAAGLDWRAGLDGRVEMAVIESVQPEAPIEGAVDGALAPPAVAGGPADRAAAMPPIVIWADFDDEPAWIFDSRAPRDWHTGDLYGYEEPLAERGGAMAPTPTWHDDDLYRAGHVGVTAETAAGRLLKSPPRRRLPPRWWDD